MLKKISLRARLTLLSAIVMIGVAASLTISSIVGVDQIFVRDLQQKIYKGDDYSLTFTPKFGELIPDDDVQYSDYYTLQVSLSKASRDFNLWGIAGLALAALLGVGATWLMAGRALKPVSQLSEAIGEIGETGGSGLARRVAESGRQDEIGRLTRSFNAMMDTVSESYERQKRFSANAAHELKTPLATIQVGLEVLNLDEHPSRERMEKALAVAQANTDRMIRLVDDLFRLSAEEEYELCDKVTIRDLFSGILAELSPQTLAKDLTVSIDCPPNLWLTGNRTMLYRALFNLIENAVKYNRHNGTISVEASAEGGRVILVVSDSGIGIPEGDLAHIFDPFYRVDPSRSRAVGGSGLGLSLVRDIAEKHGGSIRAESTEGAGTTFTFELPADADDSEDRIAGSSPVREG